MRKLAATFTILLLAACATPTTSDASCAFKPSCAPGPPAYNPTPHRTELDNIYTYLAYAAVYKNGLHAVEQRGEVGLVGPPQVDQVRHRPTI